MGISTHVSTEVVKPVAALEGHWLEWAIVLDRHCSGFLAFVTCATGARRHATFAALASLRKDTPEALAAKLGSEFAAQHAEPLFRIAASLRAMSPRAVVESIYNECPHGFLGFLDRIGPEPLKAGLYATWHRLFEIGSPRARVLMQIAGPITEPLWSMALALDEVALVPAIMNRIARRDVQTLNHGLTVIRQSCSTITDDDLRASLSAGDGPLDAGKWVLSIINRRMDTLPHGHPIAVNDPDFQPLVTGRDHVMAARQFRNCLSRDRTLLIAVGKVSYATYRRHAVVIEFRRLTTAPWWIASDGYGPRNHRVDPEVMDEIVAALTTRGIPFLVGLNEADERLTQNAGNADFGPACLREVATTNSSREEAA